MLAVVRPVPNLLAALASNQLFRLRVIGKFFELLVHGVSFIVFFALMLGELAAWLVFARLSAAPPDGATPLAGVRAAGPIKVFTLLVLLLTVLAGFRLESSCHVVDLVDIAQSYHFHLVPISLFGEHAVLSVHSLHLLEVVVGLLLESGVLLLDHFDASCEFQHNLSFLSLTPLELLRGGSDLSAVVAGADSLNRKVVYELFYVCSVLLDGLRFLVKLEASFLSEFELLLDVGLGSEQTHIPLLQVEALRADKGVVSCGFPKLLLELLTFSSGIIEVQVKFGHFVRQLDCEANHLVNPT